MLSENIYRLRRKAGLSQEQLAERIGVSRQAVSKWEGGQSCPEVEKLIALSQVFGVPVDALTSGEAAASPDASSPETADRPGNNPRIHGKLGVGLCLAGAAGLVLFGLLTLFSPAAAEQLNESSTVTLNGTGLMLLLCVAVMAAGVALALRKK